MNRKPGLFDDFGDVEHWFRLLMPVFGIVLGTGITLVTIKVEGSDKETYKNLGHTLLTASLASYGIAPKNKQNKEEKGKNEQG